MRGLSPSKLEWEVTLPNGTSTTIPGDTLTLIESDFGNGTDYGNIRLQLRHNDILESTERILRPCAGMPPAGASVGACIPQNRCYIEVDIGPDEEVRRMREIADIVMTFEYRLSRALNDVIPDPFPRPPGQLLVDLGQYLSPELHTIIAIVSEAVTKPSLTQFYDGFEKARHLTAELEDDAELGMAINILSLVENHIHYYSDVGDGGAGGWFDYSFVPGWNRNGGNAIQAAESALSYTLTTWVDAYERSLEFSLTGNPLDLDDQVVLDRMRQAGTEGAARDLVFGLIED